MPDKHLRSTTWYVTISCMDPKDDYVMKVKALTDSDAMNIVRFKLNKSQHIKDVSPARPKKRAPPRNRTETSALRKRRSGPLNQRGKKK